MYRLTHENGLWDSENVIIPNADVDKLRRIETGLFESPSISGTGTWLRCYMQVCICFYNSLNVISNAARLHDHPSK